MAKTQVVVENVADSKSNVLLLRFRLPESGTETPSFMINVKEAKSYTKWNVTMKEDFDPRSLTKIKGLFEEVIKSPEFEIVLGEYKNSEIDGELLSKFIQLTMWVETITCDSPEFYINDKNISTHILGARKVSVSLA